MTCRNPKNLSDMSEPKKFEWFFQNLKNLSDMSDTDIMHFSMWKAPKPCFLLPKPKNGFRKNHSNFLGIRKNHSNFLGSGKITQIFLGSDMSLKFFGFRHVTHYRDFRQIPHFLHVSDSRLKNKKWVEKVPILNIKMSGNPKIWWVIQYIVFSISAGIFFLNSWRNIYLGKPQSELIWRFWVAILRFKINK